MIPDFIIVDIETGGLDPRSHPILSIGAVDSKSNKNFYGECAPNGKACTNEALKVNGINLEDWKYKPSLNETISNFVSWLSDCESQKILAGHNPRFDWEFLNVGFAECNLRNPFHFRTVDLHTLAFARFGRSFSSDDIYARLGMGSEPRPHNALNGAMYEAKAFRMLMEVRN